MNGRKKEHKSDGKTENKQQDGRLKEDCINNNIECNELNTPQLCRGCCQIHILKISICFL